MKEGAWSTVPMYRWEVRDEDGDIDAYVWAIDEDAAREAAEAAGCEGDFTVRVDDGELFEARALAWAAGHSAWMGGEAPEVEGWTRYEECLEQLWPAVVEEAAIIVARIELTGVLSEPYMWSLEEDDGAGGFDYLDPYRSYAGDHPWDGKADGECATLTEALGQVAAAVASRRAWWVEEVRRIKAACAEEEG